MRIIAGCHKATTPRPSGGALRAVRELGVEVLLTGRPAEIGACLAKLGHTAPPPGVEIAPASQVIEMEDNPARAFKDKPDASMTVGLRLLKEGRGEAFVSAGSTGALLSAATLLIKRIRGHPPGGPGPGGAQCQGKHGPH